ncbi:MAG TPA: methyl-accepting chemotaxis protein [Solirubrobacteraceae bacterium]
MTGEIVHAVSDIAGGAERQVLMVEQARAAAEAVTDAVARSAAQAQATARAAVEAHQIAERGVHAAGEAELAMGSVREASDEVSQSIEALAGYSERIGVIVTTITGIAEQTNLLALNAAIEAARAGDQGRGFAVVAEEVRKLAVDSQRAASEIAVLIDAIQTQTSSAVAVVQTGVRRTQDGVAVVEQARQAFVEIGSSVTDMNVRIEQIAATTHQVSSSAEAMQHSISEIAAVAEQASAATEQASASAQQTNASGQHIISSALELAASAGQLDRLVAQFKLNQV